MPIVILVLFIIIIAVAAGVAIWLVSRVKRQGEKISAKTETVKKQPFHWKYIALPLAILLLTILASAYFHHLLPPEVAYRFKLDGTPDRWLSREMIIIGALTLQLFFTMLAGAIPWGVTKLGILTRQTEDTGIKPDRILSLMGNMIALPQLIVGFAMLDIFSYNAYQIHLLPLWVFALVVMGLGGIILGIFFIQAIRQASGVTR